MEHYDDQNRLHCYVENTQGPCEDEQAFVQPEGIDENGLLKNPICDKFGIRQLIRFKKCYNGSKWDPTTRKCKKTYKRNKPCGRHTNLVQCLRRQGNRRG